MYIVLGTYKVDTVCRILCVKKQLITRVDVLKLIVIYKNIYMFIWKCLMNFMFSYYKSFENFVSYKLEVKYKFNISLRYRRNTNMYVCVYVWSYH